ncbi:MAG: DUF4870 domain-containing protein [Planctomycetes bacterium]|nr:DUF4870 domain-containing protein [Planctomycetota bacterium]
MAVTVPDSEKAMLAEVGVAAEIEDPSCFDLVGVAEDCEDDALINSHMRERVKALRKWEQYRADPTVQKLATAVMNRISGAGRSIKTAKAREKYRLELQQRRGERFKQRIRAGIMPGEELDEARVQQLLRQARNAGIEESVARKLIEELAHAENPFAMLGVKPVADDESWPTAFDLLQLEESEQVPPNLEQHVARQLGKINQAESGGRIDGAEAGQLRRYVEEAGRTLAVPELVQAYQRTIVQRRAENLAAVVRLAMRGGSVESNVLLQLVHRGRRTRLSQKQIEQVLKKVAGIDLHDQFAAKPVLRIGRGQIEVHVRGDGTGATEIVGIANDGGGVLEVTVEPSEPWIRPSETRLRVNGRSDLVLTFPPTRLAPGEPLNGVVHLSSNGGDGEIEVKATLGVPGRQVTSDDYEAAGRSYLWILGFPFLLPFLVLTWQYMMSRKESPFIAFHALQGMVLSFVPLLMLIIAGVSIDAVGGGLHVLPCTAIPLFFLIWIGMPFGLRKLLQEGRSFAVPGLAGLLKRAL